MVLRIETDQAGVISDGATGLLEGRPIQHSKYVSTVEYRRHQEERSDPFTQDTDAGPFIALALEELVNYFPDDARVLCVGPREGTEMELLRDFGHEDLIGVDISIPAARWLSSVGFQSAAMDMHEMAFAPESFDVVLSRHSLEHAHSPERALREMAALLTPGGVLCVIVPKETPDKLDTHHGYPFSDLAELVEMIESVPNLKCVARADRRLNNEWNPEIWAVAVRGEPGPLPELRDRMFTRVWAPMTVPAAVWDGAEEAIFTIYRQELRKRLQILRPSVLEILAEPGLSPTVILQMGEEAWRVPMEDLPVWEREVAGSFDAVLAAGTLDASADPFAFTKFLENILSPQGVLAVVEPGFHPTGEGKGASQGIRPTEEGLVACFPGFRRICLETFGPEGSPFAVAAVWSKDGGQEEFSEIDPAFRIPFEPVENPVVELYGKPRPISEAFEVDFLRRMGPVVGGDVLFVSSARGKAGLSGCGLKTARFLEEWPEAGRDVGGPYDTVISLGGLGESPDPRTAVEGFKEALRPGGVLIFGETCLAPEARGRTRPLLWRFTRPGLARLLKGFQHVRIESMGPSNGPLAYYGWACA